MSQNELVERISRLEARTKLLTILAIVFALLFVGDLALRESGVRTIKAKSIRAESISLHDEHGDGSFGSTMIWLRSEPSRFRSYPASMMIGTGSIAMSADVDKSPGFEKLVEIQAHDDNLDVFPHMCIYGNGSNNFVRTAIGCFRLHQETPDGKKIETSVPESSLIFFGEDGKVKQSMP